MVPRDIEYVDDKIKDYQSITRASRYSYRGESLRGVGLHYYRHETFPELQQIISNAGMKTDVVNLL